MISFCCDQVIIYGKVHTNPARASFFVVSSAMHLLQLLGQICNCSGGEVQTSAAYSDTNFIIAYCSCNRYVKHVHYGQLFSASSPGRSKLALLSQVMQLGSKFQEYNVQKASQVACRLQPQYESYLGIAQAHAKVLDTAVAELEAKADTTHKQKADGEAFRGEQFVTMSWSAV